MTLLTKEEILAKSLEVVVCCMSIDLLLLLTFQARKIKVCYRGELKHWEKHDRPHYERGLTLFGLLV